MKIPLNIRYNAISNVAKLVTLFSVVLNGKDYSRPLPNAVHKLTACFLELAMFDVIT